MDRTVGHSLQLTVRLRAPLWHVGAGWAALGGALASGVLARDAVWPLSQPLGGLLTLVLVWLLADPLLGTVWEMAAGWNGFRNERPSTASPDVGQPVHWLPYTQPGSPAWRLAVRMGTWRTAGRAQPVGPETPAVHGVLSALALALIVAAVLGYGVILLVVASTVLAWLATRLSGGDRAGAAGHLPTGPATIRALGIFGIPWLIGCAAAEVPVWPAVLLGLCLTIAYVGVLQDPLRFRLIGGGQLAMVSLLAGLHQPLAAAVGGVALTAQWVLASTAGRHPPDRPRGAVQPFILIGLLVAALALGT